MHKAIYSILVLFVSFFSSHLIGQWQELNTNINDDLNAIVAWEESGVIAGDKGLYFSNDLDQALPNWTRFNIESNSSDSILYNRTKWLDCYLGYGLMGKAYACGQDTISQKAVIMSLELPSLNHSFIYEADEVSQLNGIGYNLFEEVYFAVGNNGHIVKFDDTSFEVDTTSNLSMDLSSIHFHTSTWYDGDYWIGAEGHYIFGTHQDELNPTVQSMPGSNFADVWEQGSQSFGAGDATYIFGVSPTPIKYQYFDFGPLNANAVLHVSAYNLVGTDHGIFRSRWNGAYPYLTEWFPSSGTHNINCLWHVPFSSRVYACGSNGTLLYSDNYGGEVKPNCILDPVFGGCQDSLLSFSYFAKGSDQTTCKWYIEGNQVSNFCSDYQGSFPDIGTQTVSFVVSNGTYSDSVSTEFNVVDLPANNMTFSVSDSILCHEESIVLNLDGSETTAHYALLNLETQNLMGTSTPGNGGAISFNSDLISETGNFQVIAEHNQAVCINPLLDTVQIVVEKTRAEFHAGLVNAEISEMVNYFEQCYDAQNYQWTFVNDYVTTNSSSSNPSETFDFEGLVEVTLICSSDDGCVDTLVQTGPMIYDLPAQLDSCWHNHNKDEDETWNGGYVADIAHISKAQNGFLASGQNFNTNFESQLGDSLIIPNKGLYAMKYSLDGTVKWAIHNGPTNESDLNDQMSFVKEDLDGNIYCAGHINNIEESALWLYDNAGDSIKTPSKDFVLKTDHSGKMEWLLSNDNRLTILSMYHDHDNNTFLVCENSTFSDPISTWYLNGDSLFSFTETNDDINWFIIKLSEDAEFIWKTDFYSNSTNGDWIDVVEFDNDNNAFITGASEYNSFFFDANNPNPVQIIEWSGSFGPKMFVIKLNEQGDFLWNINSTTIGHINASVVASDIVMDEFGNAYICGRNDVYSDNHEHIINNADGTTTTASIGQFFVAKISGNGICEWIQGAKYSYYGGGTHMTIQDNLLSIIGYSADNGFPASIDFTSSNGNEIHMNLGQWDMFLAKYSLEGELIQVCRSAFDANFTPVVNISGFIQIDESSFISAENISHSSNGLPFEFFGETLEPGEDYEGYISRFTENCGYCYYPGFNTTEEVGVCVGTNYTMPDGTTIYSIDEPFVYTSNLLSVDGLDSLVFSIVDTVSTEVFQIEIEDLCYGSNYEFPDGFIEENITESFTHQINYPLSQECDSLVIYNVNPLEQINGSMSIDICMGDDYTFPDGTSFENIESEISHTISYSAVNGCDSLATTILVPIEPEIMNELVQICFGDSYEFPDGTFIQSLISDTIQTSVLSNAMGCDSIVNTSIEIQEVMVEVLQIENYLEASGNATQWQWIDCENGNMPIAGEDNSVFLPSENGNYAVVVSAGLCTDTSSCIAFTISSLLQIDNQSFLVFPNPVQDVLNVEFNGSIDFEYIIYDIHGKIVTKGKREEEMYLEIEFPFSRGAYLLKLVGSGESRIAIPILKL